MPQVFAGNRCVPCFWQLLETELYSYSCSCRHQSFTVSQVVAGNKDVSCLKYLLESKKHNA